MMLFLQTFFGKGSTVNCAGYAVTLKKMKKMFRTVCSHKNAVILHCDNARPHTSVQQEAIQDLQFTILSHPLYSPDLVPYNFHLFFLNLKNVSGEITMTLMKKLRPLKLWF
jgi:hypothetical protein